MVWRQTDAMHERRRMIEDFLAGLYGKSELALRYGVSRQTIIYWIKRFNEFGYAGLEDRSHATHQCPHRSAEDIRELIIRTRREHPRWGPRTIRDRLTAKDTELRLPAISTIGDIIKRAGLIESKRRSKVAGAIRRAAPTVVAPNELWNIDFKGQHRLGTGEYVYPLTMTDTYSRFVLCCHGYPSTRLMPVRERVTKVFEEFGLPEMIRSDNGSPFAGNGLWALSRLNVWWMKLGIVHILSRPGHPQDNGQHERFHRTQKAETTLPIAATMEEQQGRYVEFRRDFNHERPHQGISSLTPAVLYRRSERALPTVIKPPEYPGHCEVRTVGHNGMIKFNGKYVFLSETLGHEQIALEPIDDEVWAVLFYSTELGRLETRSMMFR